MWDVLKRAPRGRISLRNLSLLATGILVAVLLNLGITSPVFAEDVTRTTDGFYYNNQPFSVEVIIQPGDPRNLTTAATGEVAAYENLNPERTKASYIYFAKGVDPKTATTALYTTFDYKAPNTYSNQSPSPPQTVTIADGEVPLQATNTGGCQIPGIGWLMCPVTNFLAVAVDGIYGVIMMFLDVSPMLSNSPVFDIWNMVRSIANIAFVIVFLIVIFSQVTSIGISTYGVRKALPRLIIAAILVNISFYIAALGIDLSNFLGHSVYALLNSSLDIMKDVRVTVTWEEIAGWILGGGAAVGTVGFLWLSVATAGSILSAFFTLIGMLITVVLSLLTAFVILAARQALLIILTIISPLAFVALVLPSTEKWFTKWKDAFLTLLIMFPIFSLVFAGAQLAGAAIIIGSPNNVYMAILGKAVQLIPLAIAPIIVKFSTGILGTIAKMTNDRNKGLIDRAKNWTDSQADHHRKKLLAGQTSAPWGASRFNGLRRMAQWSDSTARRQKMEQQGFEDAADARAKGLGTGRSAQRRLSRYRNAYNYTQDMKSDNESQENLLKGDYDKLKRNDSDTLMREIRRRQTEVYAKRESESLDRMHADITAEGASNPNLQRVLSTVQNAEIRNLTLAQANQIKLDSEEIAFEGMAKRLAEAQHKSNVTEHLSRNQTLRDNIGRIRGEEGAQLVHATAIAEERKQYGEFVSARQEIMKHFKIDSRDTKNLAMGINVTKTRDDGTELTFKANDQYTREAAVENIFTVGAYGDLKAVIESTGVGGVNYDYRATILSALQKSGRNKSAPYFNDKAYDIILNGGWDGETTTREQVVRRIMEGRITTNDIISAHANALDDMFSSDSGDSEWVEARNAMFGGDIEKAANYQQNYLNMKATAIEVLKDPQMRQSTSTESINKLKRILGITQVSLDGYDWDTLERSLELR